MIAIMLLISAMKLTATAVESQDIDAFNSATIEGVYKFDDGDTFTYECGGGICHDVLIRDKFLQDNIINLNGKTIKITVERVLACPSGRPILPACIGNPSGSALKIVAWLEPKSK